MLELCWTILLFDFHPKIEVINYGIWTMNIWWVSNDISICLVLDFCIHLLIMYTLWLWVVLKWNEFHNVWKWLWCWFTICFEVVSNLGPVCLQESEFLWENEFRGKWIPGKWIPRKYFPMFGSVMENELENTFQCLVMLWKMIWKIIY